MDYSKLSDFEINKLVARALDKIKPSDKITAIDCYLSDKKSSGVKWYKHDYFDTSEFDLFNPCNNPSDAWPIITENGIDIVKKDNNKDEWMASEDASLYHNGDRYMIRQKHKNPLRAAMIVYLMIQEQ